MADPLKIQEALEAVTGNLDTISKEQYRAYGELQEAEEAWEDRWDQVAEDLKDDLAKSGSSRDPAEHTILTATRRLHRDEYRRWRRAKREVEKLERVGQNRRQELSGYQSLLKTLDAEVGAQGYVGQGGPPNYGRAG